MFAVLVSILAGDYAGRENKQLCHPSVHTNTQPGADCTVGKMTPKLCVMSRKRLETALAMLKIDISGGKKKKTLYFCMRVGLLVVLDTLWGPHNLAITICQYFTSSFPLE